MREQTINIKNGTFKSPLPAICAILYAIATIVGLIAVIIYFDPQSIIAIRHGIVNDQITDAAAVKTWTFVYIALTVVNLLCTLALTIGLTLNVFKKHYAGMNCLVYSAKGAYYALTVAGIAAAVFFVYKLVTYIIFAWSIRQDYLGIFATILMEAMVVSIVCFLFFKLRQFLSYCALSATSINYTLHSDKIEAPSFPPLFVYGFLILGIVDIVVVIDRLFTFSYAGVNGKVEYYLNFTPVIVQRLSATPFLFAGIGSILLFVYLRSFKSKAEKLLYANMKAATN